MKLWTWIKKLSPGCAILIGFVIVGGLGLLIGAWWGLDNGSKILPPAIVQQATPSPTETPMPSPIMVDPTSTDTTTQQIMNMPIGSVLHGTATYSNGSTISISITIISTTEVVEEETSTQTRCTMYFSLQGGKIILTIDTGKPVTNQDKNVVFVLVLQSDGSISGVFYLSPSGTILVS